LSAVLARDVPEPLYAPRVLRAFARRPRGLFVDIDGTISAIADTPEQATVTSECSDALRRLTRLLDVVCLLTGRPADDAWRMVGVDDAIYAGNHGAERWYRGELLRPPGIERYQGRLARAAGMLRGLLANTPAISFEDKGIGFAIHYRRDPAIGPEVLEAAARVCRGLGLEVLMRTAHVEVRAPVPADKGTALTEIARRHGLAGLVVIGDDPVDAPAFAAARSHALDTGADVVVVTVGDQVRGYGDLSLDDPAGTCRLLDAVARELER
jgi:trehalose 6-phosphate phosphatase